MNSLIINPGRSPSSPVSKVQKQKSHVDKRKHNETAAKEKGQILINSITDACGIRTYRKINREKYTASEYSQPCVIMVD